MATIVTRSGKGSPLTHAEVDANFTNLNTDKLELSGGTMTGNLDVQGTVTADGLTVDTNTLHVDATNNRVGIGTTTPAAELHIVESGGTPEIRLADGTNAAMFKMDTVAHIGSVTNVGLAFDINSTEEMRLTSAGLGIGTSSPDVKLHVSDGALRVAGTETAGSFLNIAASNTGSDGVNILASYYGSGSYGPIKIWTGGSERMRIDSSGNVGIGTSSPDEALVIVGDLKVDNGVSAGVIHFGDVSDQTKIVGFDSTGSIANTLLFTTNGSERMRIDSSGRVGIGTSSPSAAGSGYGALDVRGAAGGGIRYGIASGFNMVTYATGTSVDFVTSAAGDIRFFNKTATGESMRIDSSGNVGIGGSAVPSTTSYNSATLHLRQAGSSSVGSQLRFTNGNSGHTNTDGGFISYWTDNNFYFNNQETGDFRFFSGGSERMRLDSSGNLLVGKSVTTFNTAGTRLSGVDGAHITRSGGASLNLNRLSSDGDILGFYKDGSTVGSIGARVGDLYLGTGDTGITFTDSVDAIRPVNTSTQALRDAAIDIGASSYRFKDLYLSGGVYLGGTGAANKLDDYEEGTWTPAVAAGSISGTSITYTGTYRKIGSIVLIRFQASNTTGDISVSSYVAFSGLPFACNMTATSTVTTEDIDQFDRQGFAQMGSSTLTLSNCGSTSGTTSLSVSIVGHTA